MDGKEVDLSETHTVIDDGGQQKLANEIGWWRGGIASFVLALVLIYAGWFWGKLKLNLSSDAAAWGQLGDFIGGLVNPVVAFAAFYWLTRSVQIQKQELAETKQALIKSAEAQNLQARHAANSVRLTAMASLNNMVATEISRVEQNLAELNPLKEEDRVRVVYFRRRLNDCLNAQRVMAHEMQFVLSGKERVVSVDHTLPEIVFVVHIFSDNVLAESPTYVMRFMYRDCTLREMFDIVHPRNNLDHLLWGAPADAHNIAFYFNGNWVGTFNTFDWENSGAFDELSKNIGAMFRKLRGAALEAKR